MARYNAPGVYVEDVVSGSQTIAQESASVGAMIGVTRSGTPNVMQRIGSWTEFIEKFANGLDTPFMENSYLPHSVYGFFQNGGQELYIYSIKKNAQKATATGKIVATAVTPGTWGNGLKVQVKKNADWSETNKLYDVVVTVGSNEITVQEVTFDNIAATLNANSQLKQWFSDFATATGESALAEETLTLSGGTDGTTLTDADYIAAIDSALDSVDDVYLVAIPGQTSSAVNAALIAYCNNHKLFPILDMPRASTVDETKTYRKSIQAFTGCLCYPWGIIYDPLTNANIAVPTAGYVMGVYARTIENRGVFKAPAGTEAVIQGFLDLEYAITKSNLNVLNPIGVVCIMSRPNAGIVIWGARSLNSTDTTMRYVTDGLLNLNIYRSLYNGTQYAVFEPHDPNVLWKSLETSCKAFLETLRNQGALKGEPEEAYYVTIDESNNSDADSDAGILNIEIGYAPVKPAEFIVIKLAHSIESVTE